MSGIFKVGPRLGWISPHCSRVRVLGCNVIVEKK